MAGSEIIHTRNLTLTYDDSPLFENLSFSIHRSEILAIVGANGCGKSTILNLLQADRRARLIEAGLRINGTTDLAEGIKIASLPQNLRLDWSPEATDPHDHARLKSEAQLRHEFGFESPDKPVSELELSVRSRKAVQRLGITTVGELSIRSEPELINIKNFGQTSLMEIKRQLAAHGLSLRQPG